LLRIQARPGWPDYVIKSGLYRLDGQAYDSYLARENLFLSSRGWWGSA
jgi:hypothetical protein